MAHLQVSAIIPAQRATVFELLCNPERLSQLMVDNIDIEMTQGAETQGRGSEYRFVMTRYGLSQPVLLRVEEVWKNSRLTYRQVEGLFADWIHTMKFEDHGEDQTLVTDYIDYRLPMGILGYLADDLFVRKDVENFLGSRLERAKEYFAALKS